MFTSQMIAGGTVKPKEVVKAFGVPMVAVKRYVKVYRDHGSKGFYAPRPRHSSASVLKGPVLRVDRLVQSVRQHVQFRRHFRHAPRPIEQPLGLFRCAARPVLDHRSDDEIIGYDEHGLPS